MPYILVRIGAPYEGWCSTLFHLPRNYGTIFKPKIIYIIINVILISISIINFNFKNSNLSHPFFSVYFINMKITLRLCFLFQLVLNYEIFYICNFLINEIRKLQCPPSILNIFSISFVIKYFCNYSPVMVSSFSKLNYFLKIINVSIFDTWSSSAENLFVFFAVLWVRNNFVILWISILFAITQSVYSMS